MSQKDSTAVEDDLVVAKKFSWTDLYRSEDWWAIWLGFTIIIAGLIAFTMGTDAFKAAKLPTWGTEEMPSILGVFSMNTIVSLVITYLIFLVLFSIGTVCMKGDLKKFAIGFTAVYLLSALSYLFAGQVTMKKYLEYAFWALLIGMFICNVIKTPDWVKPAIKTEFYIKTGLVIMGAEVLFSNIAAFGIYGLGIAWFVTPIVIVFMWLFGTKVLKMDNKPMVMIISCATSVCGTSAAIASAAACNGKKNDLTFAVGLSLIFTVIMMVTMPLFCKALNIDPLVGGAWLGGTVDSTGAVVLAGEALGDKAAQVAALVKMIQNILIGVIAFAVAIFFTTKVDKNSENKVGIGEIWHRFPKFILGFILASLLFSFVLEPTMGTDATKAILKNIGSFKGWCFCMAFVSIGLETNLKEMAVQVQGGKPLTLYVIGQLFNLVLTFFIAWLLLSGIILPIPNIVV